MRLSFIIVRQFLKAKAVINSRADSLLVASALGRTTVGGAAFAAGMAAFATVLIDRNGPEYRGFFVWLVNSRLGRDLS